MTILTKKSRSLIDDQQFSLYLTPGDKTITLFLISDILILMSEPFAHSPKPFLVNKR